jgi:glycosyltransferase involved in cell wall biosynthesis
MGKMQNVVREECCTDKIMLLGNVINPFQFMKYCSCFILPSHYEGQPMVLLEARALGLPIIVADFSTVTDSLIPGGQLLIQKDINSIYHGLVSFAKGEVPYTEFDCDQYNQDAYLEFEHLFTGKSGR